MRMYWEDGYKETLSDAPTFDSEILLRVRSLSRRFIEAHFIAWRNTGYSSVAPAAIDHLEK